MEQTDLLGQFRRCDTAQRDEVERWEETEGMRTRDDILSKTKQSTPFDTYKIVVDRSQTVQRRRLMVTITVIKCGKAHLEVLLPHFPISLTQEPLPERHRSQCRPIQEA